LRRSSASRYTPLTKKAKCAWARRATERQYGQSRVPPAPSKETTTNCGGRRRLGLGGAGAGRNGTSGGAVGLGGALLGSTWLTATNAAPKRAERASAKRNAPIVR